MTTRSSYIVSAGYDWTLFLLPPVVSLLIGIGISSSAFSNAALSVAGAETTMAALVIGTIVHAHLVAVVFRSHGNRAVFQCHPWRFTLVPLAVWLLVYASTWVAITATVVATFWDVYHSGAQTFGFARIYERNHGVPPQVGRRLDLWVNQLLYAGPILAGVSLADHVKAFDNYSEVGATFFTRIPAHVQGVQGTLTWVVILGGTLLVGYYIWAHVRMARAGTRSSPLKIFLVSSTGLCSIYTWGFNSWGEAFFIMNLFHAVQYLGLVWATESRRMTGYLRLGNRPGSKRFALLAFLGLVGGYGLAAELINSDFRVLWSVTIVVSLMHFWYDGFVWSVARRQV